MPSARKQSPTHSSPRSQPAFVGPPAGLTGTIALSNHTDRRRVIRSAALSIDELQGFGTQSSRIGPVVVAPDDTLHCEISLSVPPSTPAGEYTAELVIDETSYAARLIVVENIDLEIAPRPVVVESARGGDVDKHVTFRNRGNVSLTIGEIGPVVLDDELLNCRSLRGALDDWPGGSGTTELFLGSVITQAKDALERGGYLRVHNATGRTIIAPGETSTLLLRIRVPEHLDRRGRYFGTVPLWTNDLAFVVVPHAARLSRAEEDA